jgi:Flp pilus assembly protein TadD
MDPNDADARYDYGSLLLEDQRFAAAAEQLRAAVQLMPNRVEALNNLGIALARKATSRRPLAASSAPFSCVRTSPTRSGIARWR